MIKPKEVNDDLKITCLSKDKTVLAELQRDKNILFLTIHVLDNESYRWCYTSSVYAFNDISYYYEMSMSEDGKSIVISLYSEIEKDNTKNKFLITYKKDKIWYRE